VVMRLGRRRGQAVQNGRVTVSVFVRRATSLAVRAVGKRGERALARSLLCQLQDDERVSIVPTLRNAVASTPLVPSVLVFVS